MTVVKKFNINRNPSAAGAVIQQRKKVTMKAIRKFTTLFPLESPVLLANKVPAVHYECTLAARSHRCVSARSAAAPSNAKAELQLARDLFQSLQLFAIA